MVGPVLKDVSGLTVPLTSMLIASDTKPFGPTMRSGLGPL